MYDIMFQYERQHEKEKTQELTQQLDKEFKDLQGAFKKSYVRPQLLSPHVCLQQIFEESGFGL